MEYFIEHATYPPLTFVDVVCIDHLLADLFRLDPETVDKTVNWFVLQITLLGAAAAFAITNRWKVYKFKKKKILLVEFHRLSINIILGAIFREMKLSKIYDSIMADNLEQKKQIYSPLAPGMAAWGELSSRTKNFNKYAILTQMTHSTRVYTWKTICYLPNSESIIYWWWRDASSRKWKWRLLRWNCGPLLVMHANNITQIHVDTKL